MNQPREDLRRLASYVIDARIKAGFSTRKEFAVATGVTARTLGKLETASERVSNDTLARVARELHWTPDSPARVMAGGEPVPLEEPAPRFPRNPFAAIADPADEPADDDAWVAFPDPADRLLRWIWRMPVSEKERTELVRDQRARRRAAMNPPGRESAS